MRESDVVVLLVGDELLSGSTRDSNGHHLARALEALGYRLRRIVVLPDEDEAIRAEVRRALAEAPAVLVSGGLGPTHDDRTTDALARAFGRGLVADEAGWARLVERYVKRFGSVEEAPADTVRAARKMVMIPEGARPIANRVGAASGYALAVGGGRVIVLPGVPAELEAMFAEEVAGTLLPPLVRGAVVELEVRLPEAAFARALGDLAERYPDVTIGSYPHGPVVTLRFRGPADRAAAARDEARRLLDA